MKLKECLLNLLYPPRCPLCGKLQREEGLCPDCQKGDHFVQEEDGVQQLSARLRCASPLYYEGVVREGLLRFKFRGGRASARPFGELLASCAAEHYAGEFQLVTWVPVSKKRKRERGYDQGELLAKAACRLWDTKPERLLQKTQHNPAQSGIKDAAERRANVLGVYELMQEEKIAGKGILLMDDICTTGATLQECARMLYSGGARSVMAVTVARKRGKAGPHGGSTQEKGTKDG